MMGSDHTADRCSPHMPLRASPTIFFICASVYLAGLKTFIEMGHPHGCRRGADHLKSIDSFHRYRSCALAAPGIGQSASIDLGIPFKPARVTFPPHSQRASRRHRRRREIPVRGGMPVLNQVRAQRCEVVKTCQHGMTGTDRASSIPVRSIIWRCAPGMPHRTFPPHFADRAIRDISRSQIAITPSTPLIHQARKPHTQLAVRTHAEPPPRALSGSDRTYLTSTPDNRLSPPLRRPPLPGRELCQSQAHHIPNIAPSTFAQLPPTVYTNALSGTHQQCTEGRSAARPHGPRCARR